MGRSTFAADYWELVVKRLRKKNLLLAITVLLAVQFCFPLVLRAGSNPQVAEMISLGVKDAEAKVEACTAIEVPTFLFIACFQNEHSILLTDRFLREPDRRCNPLPPTAGLHPSAP